MQKRDYVRPSKKTNNNKIFIFSVIIILLLSAASFLWFLKEKAPAPVQKTITTAIKKEPSILPSRPEERYSYIRDLETREIAVDDEQVQNKLAQLNEKQKALLKERELAEKKRLSEIEQSNDETPVIQQIKPIKTPKISIQKEELSKIDIDKTEQKREEERLAIEQRKLDKQRQDQKEQAKQATQSTAHFGVQCGAFKNTAQAENMYARLSMAGFNAQIVKGNKWNRVIIAPINTKSEAKSIMKKVKPIADCIVVGL